MLKYTVQLPVSLVSGLMGHITESRIVECQDENNCL